MERRAIWMSLVLHGVILALMLYNFSFSREYSKPPAAIMHIDLNKVQISDKTNLPQKKIKKEKNKTQLTQKIKKENPEIKKSNIPKKQQKEILEVKKISKPVQKIEPIPAKQKEIPASKTAVQTQNNQPLIEKKSQIVPSKKQKVQNDLQSLLASVDKIRQTPQKKELQEEIINSSDVIQEGNPEGRLDQIMSVSDKDFISSKLRDCWNVDGGTDRLDEIIVEVHLSVNKEGNLLYAKYTNKMNIPAFVQVAESAVRAVYICAQKGEDSPFKILAKKYASHFSDWKEMSLRFSPTEGIY